jgi:hypothetical protein
VRNVIRFLAFLVAFVITGAGPAPAQGFLIGSLDCGSTGVMVSRTVVAMRCSFLPLFGYASFKGILTLPARPFQRSGHAAWGVYSSTQFPSLVGQYVMPQTGEDKLVGATELQPELRPLADVPGEQDGPNLAIRARRLTLQ